MVTISSRTELSSAASADEVLIEDVSVGTTKKITVKNLAGHGYGQLTRAAVDSTGSLLTMSGPLSYTTVTYTADGEAGGATVDYTIDAITLPATGGLYRIGFSVDAASSAAASQRVYFRLYDGTALIAGSERSLVSKGASSYETVSAEVIYSSSGSEVIVLQAKASAGNVLVDGATLIVTPIPASA
jgi:hypothetical protein